ncbi:hypothetical protein HU200_062535 [Digitaria exilis]|uniref:CASP-like protein n=1 Tax=Digitaria exilis TaxID=1010633 RepID=A0A835A5L7_9POAL|nr:hypothetical protein HU200_062535 [Digitaria exilis]
MALSWTAWVAGGLVARLLAIASLAMSVRFVYANHTDMFYDYDYNKLQSYTYAVAAAAIGMAVAALQVPVSVYLLCRSKRMTPSAVVLDVSMYADMAAGLVLASAVGAGFGATDDVLQFMEHGVDYSGDDRTRVKDDLTGYFHRAIVAVVFLLVGMVLSVCAAVASTRLRARASDDSADA